MRQLFQVQPASTNCQLRVRGHRAFLTGNFPEPIVREATSYFVEGYRFSPAYRRFIFDPLTQRRRRAWDGRCHLYDVRTHSMPAGLLGTVVRALKEADPQARVQIVRDDVEPAAAYSPDGYQLRGIAFGEGKFDYQRTAAEAAIKARQCILKLATNAGKTEVACAITNVLRVPTLFTVPSVELLHQTRERFAKRLGISIDDIGLVGDGNTVVGKWITIGTVDSLYARLGDEQLAKQLREFWQLLFVDECHTAGSDTFYDLLDACGAHYRIGLSGTPLDRHDGADLRLIAQTGDVAFEVSNKLLIERGISVPVTIQIKRIANLKCSGSQYKSVVKQAVVQNDDFNHDLVRWTTHRMHEGLQAVVLVRDIEHGEMLEDRLRVAHPSVRFIHGSHTTNDRRRAIDRFTAGEIRCLIGTSILYQGIDTPAIDVLVFADLGKSRIALLQAIGRGLRVRPGKLQLLIRDYANFCHEWMTKHSLERLKAYKRENCFNITVAND